MPALVVADRLVFGRRGREKRAWPGVTLVLLVYVLLVQRWRRVSCLERATFARWATPALGWLA